MKFDTVDVLVQEFGEEYRQTIEGAVHLANIFKVDLRKLVIRLIEAEKKDKDG